MTNDECQTTKEARMPNVEKDTPATFDLFGFALRHSFVICHSSFVIFQRQFNRKPAAFAHLAGHQHLSAMRLHDMLHNAQPNAHPLRLPPQLRPPPIKPFKYLLLLLGWYAIAVVFDPKTDGRCWRLDTGCWTVDTGSWRM